MPKGDFLAAILTKILGVGVFISSPPSIIKDIGCNLFVGSGIDVFGIVPNLKAAVVSSPLLDKQGFCPPS